MTVNENEATAAVDAAARVAYVKAGERNRADWPDEEVPPAWEDLAPMQKLPWREHVLPFVWAAMEALNLTNEYGRRIKDGSLGNGHMVGHVSSLYRTREDALVGGNGEGLFEDQELVIRRVSPWEVTA